MFSWTLSAQRCALLEQRFTLANQRRVRCAFALWLLGLALMWSPSVAAQTLYLDPQFGFERTGGVVFAEKPAGSPAVDMELRLELFQPTGPNVPTPRPGIILIHGGGFTGGSRFNGRLIAMCESMAIRGWTCVSIDYRLAGDEPVIGPSFEVIEALVNATGESANAAAIAAATEDAWAAYLWMTDPAANLGVDPERIGIGGSSAGAVTSLLAGYLLDDIGVSSKGDFDAVFDMWGSAGESPVMVQGDDPPLLIAHGENDQTVPVSGAYALRDQAEAVGLTYEIHTFPGVGHGFDIFDQEVSPGVSVFDRFVAFFYEHVAQSSGVPVPSSSVGSLAALMLILSAMGFAVQTMRKPTGQPTAPRSSSTRPSGHGSGRGTSSPI